MCTITVIIRLLTIKEKIEVCEMPNIKPISNLRNNTAVVNEASYGNRVYFTRNGHGLCAICTIILAGTNLLSIELPNFITRVVGLIDLVALPLLGYTTIKKLKNKQ